MARGTPADLPETKVMLRFLMSKQHRCDRCGKKNCRWSKAGYKPMTQQEIIEAAAEYAAQFGYTIDEALYRYCTDGGITNGTFVHFLK